MNDRLLSAYRAFLVGWLGWLFAHFTYVQAKTQWGHREAPDWHLTYAWHPYYFGVFNATLVLIPFLCFAVPTARRYGGWGSAVGRAILTYGVGTVLWGLGNFFWFTKNVAGQDVPYPSLADAGYLAVLPFAGWALWELSKVVGLTRRDWTWLPVALLVAAPVNLYIMLPQFVGAGTYDTKLSTIISSTYIASDVLLLGASIIVALGAHRAAGGRFFAPVVAVTVSLALLYVADIIFNYRIAKDTFYNSDISDLLYGLFIVASSFSTWLFLRAQVRAAAGVGASAGSTRSFANTGLTPLGELASAIVHGQERLMGRQSALTIAEGVPGIELDARSGHASAVDVVAIDALVREYTSLSGPLGEMACWTAARPVITRHPELQPRTLARFIAESGIAQGAGAAGGSSVPLARAH